MKKNIRCLNLIFIVIISLFFIGCATAPFGPTVQVIPAPGKSFGVFQREAEECQAWAFQRMGGQAAVDRANSDAVLQGVVGGAIGAGVGALTGAAMGHGGRSSGRHAAQGAAMGAGIGTAAGAVQGAATSAYSTQQLQILYDNAYAQCMYAKGNQIPSVTQRNYDYQTPSQNNYDYEEPSQNNYDYEEPSQNNYDYEEYDRR